MQLIHVGHTRDGVLRLRSGCLYYRLVCQGALNVVEECRAIRKRRQVTASFGYEQDAYELPPLAMPADGRSVPEAR